MQIKNSYSIQMSFDVPESEKRIAEQASECFEELIGLLRMAMRHLDLIYEPFNKARELDPKLLTYHRRVFRRYRGQIKENYENIIKKAEQCIVLMSEFSTDSKTIEMMNSFIANLEDVKKQVNRLLPLFSDLSSSNFKPALLAAIDGVKKQSKQFKQLINDRILNHIDTNILAKNWTSLITDRNENKIYERLPMVVRLYQERQKALSDKVV